jgi:hypothetical protein
MCVTTVPMPYTGGHTTCCVPGHGRYRTLEDTGEKLATREIPWTVVRTCSLGIAPSSRGIDPKSALASTKSACRLARLASSEGMEPDSWLCDNLSQSSAVSSPYSVGMLPVRRLLDSSRDLSAGSWLREMGSSPAASRRATRDKGFDVTLHDPNCAPWSEKYGPAAHRVVPRGSCSKMARPVWSLFYLFLRAVLRPFRLLPLPLVEAA